MSYHVEVRRSFRRAWAFNLDEHRLRRGVIEPWQSGARIELGGQEWDPRESTLTILEGPELAPPDLAYGRGWSNAERAARDVTTSVLRSGSVRVAVLAETAKTAHRLIEAMSQLGLEPVDWAAVRAQILAGAFAADRQPPGFAVLIVLERSNPPPSWTFDAGLALGAVGDRAIVAPIGDVERPASLQTLAERLRQTGR